MEDKCVVCGEYVPEGRMVCYKCEHSYNDYQPKIKNINPQNINKKNKNHIFNFLKNKLKGD